MKLKKYILEISSQKSISKPDTPSIFGNPSVIGGDNKN